MRTEAQVVSVVFHHIYPSKDVVVPLADAWKFYEECQRKRESVTISYANMRCQDGTEFRTFGKAWTNWDFELKVHRLARVGLGAYGDGGPKNPMEAFEGWRPAQRLESHGWVHGIIHTYLVETI